MSENTKLAKIEEQIKTMPSGSQEAMTEIIRGMYGGKPLLGTGGLLTNLVKDLTQIALQGEMDAHLQDNSLEEGSNRRNGISHKTIKTAGGAINIEVPRDRNSSGFSLR